jgi:NAD(P)H-hydrate repair Nnr-like enzyme with NAD(P)H-hydrate epimerase domain
MKVSSVSEMRALDRTAIEEFGIVAELLMENAGQAVYFVLLKEFGIKSKNSVRKTVRLAHIVSAIRIRCGHMFL